MAEKMKAIAKLKAGPGVELIEADVPTIGPRDVLVKVRATSICGTDLHIYNWDPWAASRVKPPMIFGHEFTGDIVEIGEDVIEVNVGDIVSAETHVICDTCYSCRTGAGHHCQNCRILGVDFQGCFADYVAIPAKNAWLNSPELPDEIASIQEPLGNAVFAVTEGDDLVGKSVLILGAGPLGQMAVAVAKVSGAARIIVSEPNADRREKAKIMGADYCIDPTTESTAKRAMEILGGPHVDVVVDMSGNEKAIRDGFVALRNGGRFTMFGLPSDDVKLDLADGVIFKGAKVIGISGRKIWQTWFTVKDLLDSGRLDVSPVVTHTFPMEQYKEAFELMRSGSCGKVILRP